MAASADADGACMRRHVRPGDGPVAKLVQAAQKQARTDARAARDAGLEEQELERSCAWLQSSLQRLAPLRRCSSSRMWPSSRADRSARAPPPPPHRFRYQHAVGRAPTKRRMWRAGRLPSVWQELRSAKPEVPLALALANRNMHMNGLGLRGMQSDQVTQREAINAARPTVLHTYRVRA